MMRCVAIAPLFFASALGFDSSSYEWSKQLGGASSPTLHWKVTESTNVGNFALQCPDQTTGWCGFGVSPGGGMSFGDFVIGYLDSDTNSPVVSDYNHMENNNGKPTLDATSQLTETNVEIVGGDMVVSFTRPLTSCDSEDLDILMGTTRVIWALGDTTPSSSADIPYHTDRGTKSLMLFLDPSISSVDGSMTDEEVEASSSHDHIDLMLGGANGGTDFKIPAYPAGGYAVEFYEPGTDFTELKLTQGNIDKNNVHYRIPRDAPNAISDQYDTIVGLGGGDLEACDWNSLEMCAGSTGVGTMYWWKTFDLSHLTEKVSFLVILFLMHIAPAYRTGRFHLNSTVEFVGEAYRTAQPPKNPLLTQPPSLRDTLFIHTHENNARRTQT